MSLIYSKTFPVYFLCVQPWILGRLGEKALGLLTGLDQEQGGPEKSVNRKGSGDSQALGWSLKGEVGVG